MTVSRVMPPKVRAFLNQWRRDNSIVISHEIFPFVDGSAPAFVVGADIFEIDKGVQ